MSEPEESTFDNNKVDAYAKHLAKVNESKNVIATQDIHNDQGALLVKAGSRIDSKTTERIVKFKLLKPIEESVAIEGDIDGAALFKHINVILAKNEIAKMIHDQLELEEKLKSLCHFYQTYPVLRQKITVLSIQMKRVYTQSLFAAWVTTIIGHQMNLPKVDMENLFVAAIAHDIGMLHIDEEVLNKKGTLTPEEWRQIYAHPIIGETILANIPTIEKDTIRAVREHHERCDGTGYPKGKFEKELGLFGQIIAMADSVVAVLARMRSEGRNFRDLMPVLQINSQAHFHGTYEALILVLRKAKLGDEGIIAAQAMPDFIDRVLFTNRFLSAWLKAAEEPLMALGFTHENRKLHMIQTVLMNIAMAVRGAGILDEGYIRFLEQVKQDKLDFAYREIEDVYIMLGEIRFHLNRLVRFIKEFLEFEKKPKKDVVELLNKALNQIAEVREKYADGDPAKNSA